MNESGPRGVPPDQGSGSQRIFGTPRHASVTNPAPSKRVCFYKSGDPQFAGLRVVVNQRTFKTFDALLDSLSKKVPLAFGVRNITTPRGIHAINTLEQLEDGKSYICSDSRKVKPVNLALARKKPAPWYHARPASSRRRTTRGAGPPPRAAPVRTPKRLAVFRNGDPSVKHTVVLQKRSTATFEWILEYISELMQFQVAKLHTADGRRVEGLPSLILCSGVVVAAGKEPFKAANYNAQSSSGSTRPSGNRMSVRRLKALNGKKKSPSYGSKSRNFSTSSERYMVNKIHNSLMESSCDLPSQPGDSAEYEPGPVIGETPSEDRECVLPNEEDIEKSFRVNQDGSMTVEMRVRLTVKEEETLHWTTTLTRSSVTGLTEPESEQEVCSANSDLLDPISSDDTASKDKTKEDHDQDPPSLGNGVLSQSSYEDGVKLQTTPGQRQMARKQGSVESIVSAGSHYYREATENGALMEQYCVVQQRSTRPIPKPRRLSSLDANSVNNANGSSCKLSEITHMESSGEEITETVLHIYEQQTCLDNYNANVGTFNRPSTSETGHLGADEDYEHDSWGPSMASDSVSIWKARNKPLALDFRSPKRNTVQARQRLDKYTKSKDYRPKSRRKAKVKNKSVRRLRSPGKRLREKASVDGKKRKKATPFSSTGFIRKIYGNKLQAAKTPTKLRRRRTKSAEGNAVAESRKTVAKRQQKPLQNPNVDEARQMSVLRKENHDVSKQMSLPAFDSSSLVANEYIQNWLKESHSNQTADSQTKTNSTENSDITTQTSPDDVRRTLVRHRIQSLENKMAPPNHLGGETLTAHQNSKRETPPSSEDASQARLEEPSYVLSTDLPLPPHDERTEEENCEDRVAYNLRCVQSAGSSQTLDNHPPSAEALPHAQHVMRMAQLLEAEVPKEEETLSRSTSIKRVPLVSNVSLERKMSLRKSCMDQFTVCNNEEKQSSLLDPKSSSSPSPNSLPSEERLSSSSMLSSDVLTVPLPDPKEAESPQSNPKNAISELPKRSKSLQQPPVVKKTSPNVSPLPKKRQTASNSKQIKQTMSMDLPSPPSRRKSKKKMLPQHLSSDSDPVDTRTTQSQRKQFNTLPSMKQSISPDETINETQELQNGGQEKSTHDTKFQVQLPNTQTVLENISYSIKSIQEITQHKRLPGSDMSNNIPDLSSYVASTFGSSSKVLLAFLSIVALKEGIANLKVDHINEVSCAEALRMIDSLRDMASMDNPRELKERLSAMQESASQVFLEGWRDFQNPGGTIRDEQNVDELLEGLDIPENLKVELMSLSAGFLGRSQEKLKANSEDRSSGMEEYGIEMARDHEAGQKMNLDNIAHLPSTQSSPTQNEDCYVELNPSRKSSPENVQQEAESKEQAMDGAQPEVEDEGLMFFAVEHQSGQDGEENEEDRQKMEDDAGDCSNLQERHPRADEVTGNQQCAYEDHAESLALEYEQIPSYSEEDLSIYDKAYGSEEELVQRETKCDKVEVAKDGSDDETSQPVAVRVSLLEKQVADSQKASYNKEHPKKFSLASENGIETFQQCTRSAPQSSLSFSYDSSGVATLEPEGNRVKYIREMFLAKSCAENAKQGQSSETLDSGGYQTRTSSDQSGGEEDPVRKSISKGFVRRTIERLYGKNKAIERPPSAPRTKKKYSSIFSPFHTVRDKAGSELSYFNSANALDTLTEATRCIAFNAQVGPGDSVPIDEGRWLIRENALIRKSISDPTGINKNLTNTAQDEDGYEDTLEDTPYSHFSTTSEPEDPIKSKICTYFSLPHTSESEVCQDEAMTIEAKLESAPKTKSERNGSVVLGMPDNKVHPLVEIPLDGEAAVVAQPKKGQGAVSRSLQEPDALDLLYNFCGENCPIL
ncbi:uncharacterized protein LOC144091503 [Stigmatopora argus]